jgi:hypothetical protein
MGLLKGTLGEIYLSMLFKLTIPIFKLFRKQKRFEGSDLTIFAGPIKGPNINS